MEFNFYSNVIVAPLNNSLFSNTCLTLLKKNSPIYYHKKNSFKVNNVCFSNLLKFLKNKSPCGPNGTYIISAGQHINLCLFRCLQSIQDVLTGLTSAQLYKFKMWFTQWETEITMKQVMEGDMLDFVDRILEVLGKKTSLEYK